MNDYILESADVTNVSIDDIELTQLFAEMAVLEAMMDCYEKQLVLMEYNEEAAEEIITESDFNIPAMQIITEAKGDNGETHQSSGDDYTRPVSDIPKKSKMLAFKKFWANFCEVIAKSILKLYDWITAINFKDLKKKLQDKNVTEVDGITAKEYKAFTSTKQLIDLTGKACDMCFSRNVLSARTWNNQKEVNDFLNKIKDIEKSIDELNVFEQDHDHHVVNASNLAEICDKLGDNMLKKRIRGIANDFRKSQTNFDADAGIPNSISDEMRKLYHKLIKAYNVQSVAFKKLLNTAIKHGSTNEKSKSSETPVSSTDEEMDYYKNAYNVESYSMNLTDNDFDYYVESTRGEIRKHDFLAWLIGWTGARYNPDNTFDFHWPKLVLSLLGMSQVAGIWAMIENYKAMRENIDDIINVEIVKIASAVLDDLKTDANGTSVNTTLSRFKKDLKELIKECKNDEKMGKSNELRSKVSDLRTSAERVLTNPKDSENLQSLVNAINAIFEKCIDKSKLPKSKNSAKTESYSMNLSKDKDFF